MTARAFDAFLIVDWSAANAPKRGEDSIWIAESDARGLTGAPTNPPTRADAIAHVEARLDGLLAQGKRVFAGFDFPFGYPAGAAGLIAGAPGWAALWDFFARRIEDNPRNVSNRYALAAAINRDAVGEPLYWGHPHQHSYDGLAPRKPAGGRFEALQFRVAERWQAPAKSVWQLAYNGAVGSQAMLGIARLEKLRRRFGEAVKVWPFETRFAETLDSPIVIAEIYPSMFPLRRLDGEVKDCAQVRTLAETFSALDARGEFANLLARPPGLAEDDAASVLTEEGWIVGAGHTII